jgi:hypothetical protein
MILSGFIYPVDAHGPCGHVCAPKKNVACQYGSRRTFPELVIDDARTFFPPTHPPLLLPSQHFIPILSPPMPAQTNTNQTGGPE